jgi:hypothetical protein
VRVDFGHTRLCRRRNEPLKCVNVVFMTSSDFRIKSNISNNFIIEGLDGQGQFSKYVYLIIRCDDNETRNPNNLDYWGSNNLDYWGCRVTSRLQGAPGLGFRVYGARV